MFKKILASSLLMLNCIYADQHQPTQDMMSQAEVERFATVMAQIKYYYIEDQKFSDLFNDAINGMMKGLDPHSAYIGPEQVKAFTTQSTGIYGGLGMEVEGDPSGAIKVISAFDDTPAKKAGIKSGDLIIAVDDIILQNIDLNDAVEMMKGKPNSDVVLTILSKDSDTPKKITLTREIIKFKAVKSKIIDNEVGYIRIATFNEKTYFEVVKAIKKIKQEGKNNISGYVIDVRDNPGGLLDSVVDITDLFLDSSNLKNKKIVSIKGRASSDIVKYATEGDTLDGLPIVVLTNKGSASASEILAGSLQDHNRAIVVGTETFGKGSVQSVIPIDDTSLIKITTALYYTPNDVSIQANGIIPDVYVDLTELPKPDEKSNPFANLSESNLYNHFENTKPVDNKALIRAEKEKIALAHDDFQLYQAVRIIEGLNSINS
ncbi:MAG: S41 family peptidase [Pseudomonadota bacterium]|nr:S41 family peptidase [Pseudomonadota bacterium]